MTAFEMLEESRQSAGPGSEDAGENIDVLSVASVHDEDGDVNGFVAGDPVPPVKYTYVPPRQRYPSDMPLAERYRVYREWCAAHVPAKPPIPCRRWTRGQKK